MDVGGSRGASTTWRRVRRGDSTAVDGSRDQRPPRPGARSSHGRLTVGVWVGQVLRAWGARPCLAGRAGRVLARAPRAAVEARCARRPAGQGDGLSSSEIETRGASMGQSQPNAFAGHDVGCEQHHAILSVPDVRSAVEFYTHNLGFWLAFAEGTPPTFAGVNLGGIQLFLERGTPCPAGCAVYFVVSDADEFHRFHAARGVTIIEAPGDRAYHLRDYTIRDPHGYRLTFGHRLRRHEPRGQTAD